MCSPTLWGGGVLAYHQIAIYVKNVMKEFEQIIILGGLVSIGFFVINKDDNFENCATKMTIGCQKNISSSISRIVN